MTVVSPGEKQIIKWTSYLHENELPLPRGNQVTGDSALQEEHVTGFHFPQQRFQGNFLSGEWSSFSSTRITIQNHCCRRLRAFGLDFVFFPLQQELKWQVDTAQMGRKPCTVPNTSTLELYYSVGHVFTVLQYPQFISLL